MNRGAEHRALSPPVYELVQRLAGALILRRRLARRLAPLQGGSVLDVGGGSGWALDLWRPSAARYVLLDLDLARLRDFRRKCAAAAVRADARQLPIASGAVDVVQLFLVAHHLDDAALATLVDECARALDPQGALVFVDPLWIRRWLPGRLLWLGDRGEHPRGRQGLLAALERRFRIELREELTILHRYLLIVARPR